MTNRKPTIRAAGQDDQIGCPLVTVYCGSKLGSRPIYEQAAFSFGQQLGQAGLGLVYGGASVGLMGQVADGVLAVGGSVVGVIPSFLLEYEVAHTSLTETHIVGTMHERKWMMAERGAAFVALPGGLGTLEELMEVATWGQLAQHDKPMCVLDVDGYYQGLQQQMQRAVEEGFMKPADMARLEFFDDGGLLVRFLQDKLCPALETAD